MKMAANERRREHLEEQNNEYENYLEEERDGETDLPVWLSWLPEKRNMLLKASTG